MNDDSNYELHDRSEPTINYMFGQSQKVKGMKPNFNLTSFWLHFRNQKPPLFAE